MAPGGIIVTRPTATAELRLRGLDPTVDEEGVRKALAQAGGCPVEEIRVGTIRRPQFSLGSLWACLPVKAAKKVSVEFYHHYGMGTGWSGDTEGPSHAVLPLPAIGTCGQSVSGPR